jgi:hypothetical protein
MALLIDGKLLFIHTPRGGGEWFGKALRNMGVNETYRIGDKHSHGCYTREIFDLLKNPDIKSMTTIRHPAEWYKSHWELRTYRTDTIQNWGLYEKDFMWHPTWDLDNECKSFDFEDFINKCVDKFPSYLSRLYDDYTRKPPVGTLDYIILTKNLEKEIPDIFEENDMNFDLENFLNTPSHNSFKNDNIKYSVDLINKILQSEKRCIEKFNFSNNIEDLKYLIK